MTDQFVCPKCHTPFEALFLFIKHLRDYHRENPAPLSR